MLWRMNLRRLIALGLAFALLGTFTAEAAHRRRHWAEPSAWRLSFSQTGRDGAPEVYAENFAPRPTPGPADWGAIQELVAYCRDHKPGLEIKTDGGAWGYSFWGPAYGVAFRVDAAPPISGTWRGSEAVNAAVFPGDAVAFLDALPESGAIEFRVADSFGRVHRASFRLRGVATVRRLIAKACPATR
jgi:hypothetical protein